ncbi:MAG TPA: polysaccharide biosynthesis tyrosine autokinase, partial [Polyangiaceae bacterium]|nr:polysaccharide biosynthesis tyrosine autokinase [Polyangiaceae bacterium]
LRSAEAEALELNLMEIEYARLQRTKENNEKLYDLVLERSKEAGLTKMLNVNNIQVLDPPAILETPVKPRVPVVLALGAVLGFILGLGAAIGRDLQDTSIKSPDDLENRLGVASLGVIPSIGKAKMGARQDAERRRRLSGATDVDSPELKVHLEPNSGFAEAIRAVRTNLLFMSPDKPFKRLLVASAGPSEGKTTLACCLGVAMAQTGRKVLLIDCDMRRPRLHTLFRDQDDTHPRSTLSQSLLDPPSLRIESLKTFVPGLDILPAGITPLNPAELLQSDTFAHLLDRVSQTYDLVLLDSPPLVVTDAAILSNRVDGVALVVRALQTDIRAAKRALRALNDIGARVVGAILNDASSKGGNYGYYGGYHGYYGHGQESSEGSSQS